MLHFEVILNDSNNSMVVVPNSNIKLKSRQKKF